MDVNEVLEEIKRLSKDDLKLLYKRLGVPSPDLMSDAEIVIHDWEGNDRHRPRATVILADGAQEEIDILELLDFDPMSIGHMAIRLALKRWVEIIRYRRTYSNYYNYWWSSYFDEKTGDFTGSSPVSRPEQFEVARSHLMYISPASLKSAEKASYSKAAAVEIERWINEAAGNALLHNTYDLLEDAEIKRIRNDEQRLRALMNKLRASGQKEIEFFGSYPMWRMDAFLKSPDGERFLFNRNRWDAFKASFEAWHFSINKDSLRRYRSEGRKEVARKWQREINLFPEFVNVYSLSRSFSLLSLRFRPAMSDEV
jgi:hypothetical protein